jgi:hypothetical protein
MVEAMFTKDTSYFLKLFRRGRYVTTRSIARNEAGSDDRQRKDSERQRKHEERERFAVAAIAFCYQHDPQFRDFFLKVVANLKRNEIETINVEPERWGDLVLEGEEDVVVLEFKLQALLGEHQDPNSKGRLFTVSGYGSEIINEYGGTGKRLRYVIIGKDGPAGRKDNLEYHATPWIEFLRRTGRESGLERDLFDCLGVLGAPIFLSRHMKKKAPTKEACGALEVYQLLERAAGSIRTGAATSGGDHIGLDLSSTGGTPKSQHKILKDVVEPRGRSLGWIGYEPRKEFEQQLCLSVWFYCSQKGKKSLKNGLRKFQAEKRGKIVEDGSSIGLVQPATDERDHEKWIGDVLKAVAQHTSGSIRPSLVSS